MIEEIIRFEHVTMKSHDEIILNNLNFYMIKGETMALLSLQDHGKEDFLRLFQQNLPLDYGRIYYEGKLINSYTNSDMSINKISTLRETSKLIDVLSVADNLFVMRKGFKKFIINEKSLKNQTIKLLEELDLDIDITANIKDLERGEQLMIEMARAILSGHQLLILHHLSNFLNPAELNCVFRFMNKLKQKNISFLYVCNHHEEGFRIADRAALFQDGSIHKVFENSELQDECIKPYIMEFKPYKNNYMVAASDYILRFRNVDYQHMKHLNFGIRKGECITIMDTDYRIPNEIVEVLTGEGIPQNGIIELDGAKFEKNAALHFLDNGIFIVPSSPIKNILFPRHTYLENFTFLLDKKIKSTFIKPAFIESIRNEYLTLFGDCINSTKLNCLDATQLYSLIYHRINLFHPKLAVLVQPMADGDMYCRKHILDLIQLLKESGISVLILAGSISDNLTVSDRLIVLKDGHSIAEYSEQEFYLIRK